MSDKILQNEEFTVNENESTIQRCPHDNENPYAQISRDLIRHPTLSIECIFLITYLLTMKNGWIINPSQLVKHLKGRMGKDTIYKVIKEAIEAGYMKKEPMKRRGRFYQLKYFVSETPKFKKCSPYPGKPDTVEPDTETPDTENKDIKNKHISSPKGEEFKEEHKEGSSTPPSAIAEGLLDTFLSKIKERNPQFKDPNRSVWLSDMDKLLRLDKRSVQKTEEIIIWASTHKWFKTACLSPAKLRKDYDSMLMQMESGKEEELVVKNRHFALGLKEKYPEQMKALFFDKNFVGNRETGKEIPFKLPIEQFKELFIPLFGGAYVR